MSSTAPKRHDTSKFSFMLLSIPGAHVLSLVVLAFTLVFPGRIHAEQFSLDFVSLEEPGFIEFSPIADPSFLESNSDHCFWLLISDQETKQVLVNSLGYGLGQNLVTKFRSTFLDIAEQVRSRGEEHRVLDIKLQRSQTAVESSTCFSSLTRDDFVEFYNSALDLPASYFSPDTELHGSAKVVFSGESVDLNFQSSFYVPDTWFAPPCSRIELRENLTGRTLTGYGRLNVPLQFSLDAISEEIFSEVLNETAHPSSLASELMFQASIMAGDVPPFGTECSKEFFEKSVNPHVLIEGDLKLTPELVRSSGYRIETKAPDETLPLRLSLSGPPLPNWSRFCFRAFVSGSSTNSSNVRLVNTFQENAISQFKLERTIFPLSDDLFRELSIASAGGAEALRAEVRFGFAEKSPSGSFVCPEQDEEYPFPIVGEELFLSDQAVSQNSAFRVAVVQVVPTGYNLSHEKLCFKKNRTKKWGKHFVGTGVRTDCGRKNLSIPLEKLLTGDPTPQKIPRYLSSKGLHTLELYPLSYLNTYWQNLIESQGGARPTTLGYEPQFNLEFLGPYETDLSLQTYDSENPLRFQVVKDFFQRVKEDHDLALEGYDFYAFVFYDPYGQHYFRSFATRSGVVGEATSYNYMPLGFSTFLKNENFNVFAHESGHVFFGLKDLYYESEEFPNTSLVLYPEGVVDPNVTEQRQACLMGQYRSFPVQEGPEHLSGVTTAVNSLSATTPFSQHLHRDFPFAEGHPANSILCQADLARMFVADQSACSSEDYQALTCGAQCNSRNYFSCQRCESDTCSLLPLETGISGRFKKSKRKTFSPKDTTVIAGELPGMGVYYGVQSDDVYSVLVPKGRYRVTVRSRIRFCVRERRVRVGDTIKKNVDFFKGKRWCSRGRRL